MVVIIGFFAALAVTGVSVVFFALQLYASFVISSAPFIIVDAIIKRNDYADNRFDTLRMFFWPIVVGSFVGIQVIMFGINKSVLKANLSLWGGVAHYL